MSPGDGSPEDDRSPSPEDDRSPSPADDRSPSPEEHTSEPSLNDSPGRSFDDSPERSFDDSPEPAPDDRPGDGERWQSDAEPLSVRSDRDAEGDEPDQGIVRRFLAAESGLFMVAREILSAVLIVLLIGGILFGISGVWPPMVAIESGSMEPNIKQYDLVFVTEPDRFAPSDADRSGIVTKEVGERTGYESFGQPGSVIVFDEPDAPGPPIIHRPHLFVEEGENWYDRANPEYMSADDCEDLESCPAPHDGYITKGDNNGQYDQANGIAPTIDDSWVTGVARLRIPYLGWIRLAVTGATVLTPTIPLFGIAIGSIAASRYRRTTPKQPIEPP